MLIPQSNLFTKSVSMKTCKWCQKAFAAHENNLCVDCNDLMTRSDEQESQSFEIEEESEFFNGIEALKRAELGYKVQSEYLKPESGHFAIEYLCIIDGKLYQKWGKEIELCSGLHPDHIMRNDWSIYEEVEDEKNQSLIESNPEQQRIDSMNQSIKLQEEPKTVQETVHEYIYRNMSLYKANLKKQNQAITMEFEMALCLRFTREYNELQKEDSKRLFFSPNLSLCDFEVHKETRDGKCGNCRSGPEMVEYVNQSCRINRGEEEFDGIQALRYMQHGICCVFRLHDNEPLCLHKIENDMIYYHFACIENDIWHEQEEGLTCDELFSKKWRIYQKQ